MRKNIMAVCLSLILVVGTVGAAYALGIQQVVFRPIEDATLDSSYGNLCWAATAANMLAYSGWGIDHDGDGIVNGQTVLDEIRVGQPNQTGTFRKGLEIYYNLHASDWGQATSFQDWLDDFAYGINTFSLGRSVTLGSDAPGLIADLLSSGYAPSLTVDFAPLSGADHGINGWGYQIDSTGNIDQLVITDNEWTVPGPQNVTVTPDISLNRHVLGNYERFGSVLQGPSIEHVGGLRGETPTVDVLISNVTDQPIISAELAHYIQSFYDAVPPETGITDAPLIGFNGVELDANDTGWDFLHYTPGPNVSDQIVGNGIDDLTGFSFDFPTFSSIEEAELFLTLTPQRSDVLTDLLLFADLPSSMGNNFGNSLFADLEVNHLAELAFDLTAMPSAYGLTDLRNLLLDGDLGVVFGDDAILHSASLQVSGVLDLYKVPINPVPEPSSWLLISIGLFALIGLCHRRKCRSRSSLSSNNSTGD